MNLADIALPPPGSGQPIPTTSTGDVQLVRGVESLEQWMVRAALTTPGAWPSAPDFGGGAMRALGQPVTATSGIAAQLRRTVSEDRRVVSVTVSTSRTDDGRVLFEVVAETVDDTTASADLVI